MLFFGGCGQALVRSSKWILQVVMTSARTLQDISDDRVVPGDFLAVLLLLFFFMVLDRLFYTLGLHLGKVMPTPSSTAR